MEIFARSLADRIAVMPNSDSWDCVGQPEPLSGNDELFLQEDLLMEQILDKINATPIGQVLKKIASLPEVRKEKVLDLRRQITDGRYDLNGRLDVALEKVLEELTE